MKVFAPSAFRWPANSGQDYPYGLQDIGNDTLARALLSAGVVVADDPGDQVNAGDKPLSPLSATQVAAVQSLVSTPGNLARLPSLPTLIGGSISDAYKGGATPWTMLYGPNELRQAPWAGSNELIVPSAAAKYVTAASGTNGPCMFRANGASQWVDGSVINANTGNPNYGQFRNTSAGLAAGALANTTIGILIYLHRVPNSVHLRIGVDTGNYVYYPFDASANLLVEGWNFLIAHTAEPIGANASGQYSFQSANSTNIGWQVGAGSFAFSQAVTYVSVELTGITKQTNYWIEALYTGGKDKPRLTIGFDIQGAGVDPAKVIMDKYGLVGYAAVPTSNAVAANPSFLWAAADVARMQALYSAGWDIIQHSTSHNSMGTLSDDGMLLAEYEACREQIIAIGCPAGADLFASPNGSWSNRTVAVGAKAGIRWMRHVNTAPMLVPRGVFGMANPLTQGAMGMHGAAVDAARIIAFIDLMILYGCSGHLYTHGVIAGASDSLNTNSTIFDTVCAYIATKIAAGIVEVVTPSKYIRESGSPNIGAVLANPSRLSLTAGASPYDLINPGYLPLRYQISGGTVSAITYSRDGVTFDSVGSAVSGQFDLNPGDRLRITYTVAPTIIQYSI